MNKYQYSLDVGRWIDIVAPTKEDLSSLVETLDIPERILVNSLNSEHLPKIDSFGQTTVIYLRVIEPRKKANAFNIQEMTTKITLILKPGLVLSIHRLDPEFMVALRAYCEQSDLDKLSQQDLIKQIMTASIGTFDEALNQLESQSDRYEAKIFNHTRQKSIIQEGYTLKRKASAFRKVLKFSLDILNSIQQHPEFIWRDFQGVREDTERYLFYTEDVLENVTGLLNLHISLSSQRTNEASFRTNEVMRILTVFSIFFLPLNFIAGIYGMNFEYMPELKQPLGYFFAIGAMALIALFIFLWVFKKGWLREPKD
jgi:magnesium transporter